MVRFYLFMMLYLKVSFAHSVERNHCVHYINKYVALEEVTRESFQGDLMDLLGPSISGPREDLEIVTSQLMEVFDNVVRTEKANGIPRPLYYIRGEFFNFVPPKAFLSSEKLQTAVNDYVALRNHLNKLIMIQRAQPDVALNEVKNKFFDFLLNTVDLTDQQRKVLLFARKSGDYSLIFETQVDRFQRVFEESGKEVSDQNLDRMAESVLSKVGLQQRVSEDGIRILFVLQEQVPESFLNEVIMHANFFYQEKHWDLLEIYGFFLKSHLDNKRILYGRKMREQGEELYFSGSREVLEGFYEIFGEMGNVEEVESLLAKSSKVDSEVPKIFTNFACLVTEIESALLVSSEDLDYGGLIEEVVSNTIAEESHDFWISFFRTQEDEIMQMTQALRQN